MPADNERFCESGGVCPPEQLCNFAGVPPARALVNPRPRKAATTLYASERQHHEKVVKKFEKYFFSSKKICNFVISYNNNDMDTGRRIETGDSVLISPDLTGLTNWTEGTVVEVENNTFNGIVVAAETKDRNVFFGQKDLFKTTVNDRELCLQ
jgi:hypothetical protein